MERSLKELIPLLINRIQTHSCPGLCSALMDISQSLTYAEYMQLSDLIDLSRPKWYEPRFYCIHGVFDDGVAAYHWDKWSVRPRVRWLKRQLKKCSEEMS